MSIRVRYSIKTRLSSDPTNEQYDLGNLNIEVVDDQLAEGGTRSTTLAAGAVDEAIDMCGIADVKFLHIRTAPVDPLDDPAEVRLKLNGGSEEIAVLPIGVSKEGHFLISSAGITSVTASNPGAVDMKVTVAAAGD
jgi:hypothetical protein